MFCQLIAQNSLTALVCTLQCWSWLWFILDTRIPKVFFWVWIMFNFNFLKTIFALTSGCLKGIIDCVITKLMKLNWFEKCHKLNSNFHQCKYCDLNVEVHKVRKPFVIRFKNKYKLNFWYDDTSLQIKTFWDMKFSKISRLLVQAHLGVFFHLHRAEEDTFKLSEMEQPVICFHKFSLFSYFLLVALHFTPVSRSVSGSEFQVATI